MTIMLTEDHLHRLFETANFDVPQRELIFIGLRGCVPVGGAFQPERSEQQLEIPGTDYMHMRCSLLQWRPGKGFSAFAGSTVPHLSAVRSHIAKHGDGVNQLALGFYRGDHGYVPGTHAASDPNRAHRAFRNTSALPTWRTGDDDDYDGADRVTYGVAYDNFHCAWQMDPAMPSYSSYGCQVVAGRPRVLARGWDAELGPWAEFVRGAMATGQKSFAYALFSGREVAATASAPLGTRPQNVRFGSSGELVHVVQDALLNHGYDLGPSGADGDFGWNTLQAVKQFQLKNFGPGGVDLIVGPGTASLLGLDWPRQGGAPPPLIPPLAGAVSLATPASAAAAPEVSQTPDYRTLTKGGFFSADPWDLRVRRAIRTNNPGALNITDWQRKRPGFVGQTQPDQARNKTTIYVTPEHGIAAWHYLLHNRYGYGKAGGFGIAALACRYAGVADPQSAAVRSYLSGWKRWSGGILEPDTRVSFDDDKLLLDLARGMFGHEAGQASPIKDEQIVEALRLERTGTLPEH